MKKEIEKLLKEYDSKLEGLTQEEAKKRLELYGPNEIKRIKRISPLKIFISQFTSPLILILILAALISFFIGFLPKAEANPLDTILILLIVLISGIAGFIQDYKAEKTIEALRKMATPKARVIRENKEIEIPTTEVVPGDILVLEAGDVIAADAKLIECFNLSVDESLFTGESRAVKKKVLDKVFMDTFVFSGNAKALVIATGMQTEVGRLAMKVQKIEKLKTPFQVEIKEFTKKICYGIIGLLIAIGLIGFFKFGLYEALLISISLSVAALPEGLPAVLTLALALGGKEMVRQKALVRRLPIVESIGSVNIICTDKTGTLTENQMSVTRIFFQDEDMEVEKIKDSKKIEKLLICGALCNNVRISGKKYIGDQTEIAIRRLSDSFELVKEELEKKYRKIDEVPFSSERKMMSVVYEYKGKKFVFSKGAPEILIKKCDRILLNGQIKKLDKKHENKILEKNKEFASNALRVLGFAFKELKEGEEIEKNLIWLGLEGMIDPPRKEVKQAIEDCKRAGIRVIMITGDNPETAKAIAREIGLESKDVVLGEELDKMDDKRLEEKLNSGVNIFARTSPFHKLRILEILQKKGNVVAMTGDGVNDSLALKKADVGIAMGLRGTEVAKEASDIILLDDNFATIRNAVKEGRRIFDNIQKFVSYLFVCNIAEVLVLFLGILLFAINEPLLFPVQILWINLLTDGLPAIALGLDPARPDVLKRKPRKKGQGIIDKQLAWIIPSIGLKKSLIILLIFFLIFNAVGLKKARTALFTAFILYEFIRIEVIRFQEKMSFFANKLLVIALFVSLIAQLIIIYSPLNSFFYSTYLGLYEWIILAIGFLGGFATSILITELIMKYVK